MWSVSHNQLVNLVNADSGPASQGSEAVHLEGPGCLHFNKDFRSLIKVFLELTLRKRRECTSQKCFHPRDTANGGRETRHPL